MFVYQFRVQKNFWSLTTGRTLQGYLVIAVAATPIGLLINFALFYALATTTETLASRAV